MPPRKRALTDDEKRTAAELRAERLAEIRKEHLALMERAEELVEQAKALQAEALELVSPDSANPDETVSEDVGDGKIAVQPNRRFDEATAREYLTSVNPKVLPLITVEKLDSKKAKDLLAPVAYRRCMKGQGKGKVIIT